MNGKKEWLSVTELAERLGIPDATIRRYLRMHGRHLQFTKRHKNYAVRAASVDTLIKIREAYAEGMGVEKVEEALVSAGAPVIITVNDEGERVTGSTEDALSSLQKTVNEQSEMIRTLGQIIQQQQQTAAAVLPDPDEQRAGRLNDRLTERRVERQLEREALERWAEKPEAERMRKAGWFRKEEDPAARDRFVRDYVDEHFDVRMHEAYNLPPDVRRERNGGRGRRPS